jgi:hypothetical protein
MKTVIIEHYVRKCEGNKGIVKRQASRCKFNLTGKYIAT